MRTRRRLAALLLAIVLSALAFPSTASAAVPKQVLVVGDSITGGASNYTDFYLGNAGDGSITTTHRTVGGLALCDLLPGSGGPWSINTLLNERRYDAVIVAFSGNNLTKCMGGRTGQAVVDKYRDDANAFMQIVSTYPSVADVVFAKPFAARDAGLDYVRTGVGRVYVDMALTWPTARSIDAGYLLENQGQWADLLPCQPWDPCGYGVVRIGDPDGVHLWCDKRGPAYYGVVPPCDNYSAANNRYGMNLAGARQFIL